MKSVEAPAPAPATRYDTNTIRYDGWELGVAEARHMGWWSVVGMKCGGAKCGGGGGRNDDSGGYGGENRMELETKTTPRIHESTTDPKRPDLSHLFPRLFETAVAFPRDPTQLSPSSFQIAVPFLRSITRRSSSWTSDFLLNVEARFLVHATPRHAAFPFPSSSPRHLRRDPPAGYVRSLVDRPYHGFYPVEELADGVLLRVRG